MRRVESQGRNEKQPLRKHPVSSKHFYFCFMGVWVGGNQLSRRKKRQEKRGEGISGCGDERGEQARDEGREKERCGGEMGCNSQHMGKDN